MCLEQALTGEPISVCRDGKQTRSFCYVTDTIRGLLILASKEGINGEAINIGNTEEMVILDLSKKIINITGSKYQITFLPPAQDDPRRRVPDISKAKSKQDYVDYVISNQVLEHLFYPSKFLMEVRRILKSGGIAVLSSENLSSWDNVFALLLGFTPFSLMYDHPYAKLGNPTSPHNRKPTSGSPPHRVFTYKALNELLELLGFKVDRTIGSGHLLGKAGEFLQKSRRRFITVKVRRTDGSNKPKDG